jgi:hypothetical protein
MAGHFTAFLGASDDGVGVGHVQDPALPLAARARHLRHLAGGVRDPLVAAASQQYQVVRAAGCSAKARPSP